jgi:hypothetical protein
LFYRLRLAQQQSKKTKAWLAKQKTKQGIFRLRLNKKLKKPEACFASPCCASDGLRPLAFIAFGVFASQKQATPAVNRYIHT